MVSLLLTLAALAAPQADPVPAPALDLERELRVIWRSVSDEEAAAAEERILASGASWQELAELVRRADLWADGDLPEVFSRVWTSPGGVEHYVLVFVPPDYSHERDWPMRFHLHGGMGRGAWELEGAPWGPSGEGSGWTGRRDGIEVFPAGWWDSMWWQEDQAAHFQETARWLKRRFRIDEDRVVLTGASDGAVGGWFQAFRDPTPWAGYVTLVGTAERLVRKELLCDGQMHLPNLAGQRFLTIIGGRDPKFPRVQNERYLELMEPFGVRHTMRVHDEAGHGLNLERADLDAIEGFVDGLVRDPLPDAIEWCTERIDRYARRSWLVIEELDGSPRSARALREDPAILPLISKSGRETTRGAPKRVPYGRVAVTRDGNSIRVEAEGVRRFRLLLSPEELDFSRPVRLELPGGEVRERRFRTKSAVLLEGLRRDLDRRMLFGAEWVVELPGE